MAFDQRTVKRSGMRILVPKAIGVFPLLLSCGLITIAGNFDRFERLKTGGLYPNQVPRQIRIRQQTGTNRRSASIYQSPPV